MASLIPILILSLIFSHSLPDNYISMEEGNVRVNVRWVMPPEGVIKINVHAFFTPEPLENGNVSGIGVICRDSTGDIVSMLGGSLCFEDQRENEFHAFMEGLKETFYRGYKNFILETDHEDAYWEWRHSAQLGAPPHQARIVQQLNQRRSDKNFRSEVRLIDTEDNALAAYIAQYGARTWKEMVIIDEPFGRIEELWHLDMGLGSIDNRFQAVRMADVNVNAGVDMVINPPLVAVQVEDDEEIAEALDDGLGIQFLAEAAGL